MRSLLGNSSSEPEVPQRSIVIKCRSEEATTLIPVEWGFVYMNRNLSNEPKNKKEYTQNKTGQESGGGEHKQHTKSMETRRQRGDTGGWSSAALSLAPYSSKARSAGLILSLPRLAKKGQKKIIIPSSPNKKEKRITYMRCEQSNSTVSGTGVNISIIYYFL